MKTLPTPLRSRVTLLACLLAVLPLLGGCGAESSADAASGAAASGSAGSWEFRSAPSLRPPRLVVRKQARGTADGHLFFTPSGGAGTKGLLIADDQGQPVWHRPTGKVYASDLRVQRYKGERVLTWWEGRRVRGWGRGEFVVLGADYRERARFRAAGNGGGDLHDFVITGDDTALVTVYVTTKRDLSSVGGPRKGQVVDSVIQEIDIESGRVLLKWSSLSHIALEESYKPVPTVAADAWDYFHVNSVDVDRDGNLLVSARNTHAVYKLDRKTGRVMWRLGGKRSDFAMGTGTRFAWQHDARRQRDGSLTLFDNQASPKRAPQSRGLALALDERRLRATRLRQYTHPRRLLSNNQANMQVLSNRNVMIGWGFHPYATEFTPRGRVLFDARFADPSTTSYRAYRFAWHGTPTTSPDVAVRRSGSRMTVYASWNGATEVVRWRALAGASADSIRPVATGRRRGFETALAVGDVQGCVAVEALDRAGRVLGASPVRCG